MSNIKGYYANTEINVRILSPYAASHLQALDSSDFRTRTAKENSWSFNRTLVYLVKDRILLQLANLSVTWFSAKKRKRKRKNQNILRKRKQHSNGQSGHLTGHWFIWSRGSAFALVLSCFVLFFSIFMTFSYRDPWQCHLCVYNVYIYMLLEWKKE